MGGKGKGGKAGHKATPSSKQTPPLFGSTGLAEQLQMDKENDFTEFELDYSALEPQHALMVSKIQQMFISQVTIIKDKFATFQKQIADKVDHLEKKIEDVASLQSSIDRIETSVQEIKSSTNKLKTDTIPGLVDHMNSMLTHIGLQNVDLNMHRRKFSLIIQGLPGKAEESSDDTRKAVLDMAKKNLKLKDTRDTPLREDQLSACHRLQTTAGSAVIARFVDLKQRDRWLAHAKHLANSQISMSVDVPPCLRKAKQQLMAVRKDLAPEAKKRSFVKHLPTWPYLLLQRKGEEPIHHKFTKSDIVSLALKLPEDASVMYELPAG